MNGSDRLKPRRGTVPTAAALVAAALALLAAAPADAGWLGRGIAVGGAGYAVSKTMEENIGILGKMWEAIDKNDDESFARLQAESEKTQGKLIMRAFPILGVPHAIAQKLKSAKEKIDRFVGGARQKVTDARAAPVRRPGQPAGGRGSRRKASFPACRRQVPESRHGAVRLGIVRLVRGGRVAAGPPPPPSGEAARVIAHARGCWNHEVDVSDPDDYAQFRTMMERRVRAGASLDCAETRVKAGEAGGKQAAATADVAAGSEETDPVTAWILSEQKSNHPSDCSFSSRSFQLSKSASNILKQGNNSGTVRIAARAPWRLYTVRTAGGNAETPIWPPDPPARRRGKSPGGGVCGESVPGIAMSRSCAVQCGSGRLPMRLVENFTR